MYARSTSALALMATAGLLCNMTRILAAPPPAGLNNTFPPSFYGFNPGYYGPYYPGHYQYGNVQPSTYNNYRTPAFSSYGASGNVPLFYSSQPYTSPSSTTSSWYGSPESGSAYRLAESSPSAPGAGDAGRAAASIQVHVPAPNADLWVEGWKTASKGDWRRFLSPPLVPGNRYEYEMRARWSENGREMSRSREVPLRAGEHVVVDFSTTLPSTSSR